LEELDQLDTVTHDGGKRLARQHGVALLSGDFQIVP